MKKTIIGFLTVALLCLCFTPTSNAGVEVVPSFGFGWLNSDGMKSTRAYSIGMTIPLATNENGFEFSNETTKLFSTDVGADGNEVQAIRIMGIAKKTLMTGWETSVVDGKTIQVKFWDLWLATGSGTWIFEKVGSPENPDGDDETFGAFTLRIGGSFRTIAFSLSFDVVQRPGPDLFAPMINIGWDL